MRQKAGLLKRLYWCPPPTHPTPFCPPTFSSHALSRRTTICSTNAQLSPSPTTPNKGARRSSTYSAPGRSTARPGPRPTAAATPSARPFCARSATAASPFSGATAGGSGAWGGAGSGAGCGCTTTGSSRCSGAASPCGATGAGSTASCTSGPARWVVVVEGGLRGWGGGGVKPRPHHFHAKIQSMQCAVHHVCSKTTPPPAPPQ